MIAQQRAGITTIEIKFVVNVTQAVEYASDLLRPNVKAVILTTGIIRITLATLMQTVTFTHLS